MENKKIKISSLGPELTNSHDAVLDYSERIEEEAEIILCVTPEESFDLLVNKEVDMCVVCNLYPDIHKLYIPYLRIITIVDVFTSRAKMGLYRKPGDDNSLTVSCPITSAAFIQDDYSAENIKLSSSNTVAAAMCKEKCVDRAVSTAKAAEYYGLELVKSYGEFLVPYTVFMQKK